MSILAHYAFSQSITYKSLYPFNPVQLNPAYMGNQGKLFLGFQSSIRAGSNLNLPTYSSINIHSMTYENMAIGTNFLFENQGQFSLSMGDAGLAYKVQLDDVQSLKFAMTIGFIRQTLNTSSFYTNPYVDINDPNLNEDFYDQTYLKLGAGLIYQYNNFELGIASPYLFRGGESINKEGNLTAGYTWDISQYKIKINPSVLYQVKDADADLYDINLRGIYNDKISLLAGYRSNQSINISLGFRTDFFDLGYNYNMMIGDFKAINTNSHEILLAFTIKRKEKERITKDTELINRHRNVEKIETDGNFTKLLRKYDSLSQISSDRIVEQEEKRKSIEKEIETMQEEMGLIKINLEKFESKEIKDELVSDKLAIEAGNYVVISTCKSLLCAEQVQTNLKENGENHCKIVLNKEKGYYYIVSARFSNVKEAIEEMRKKRKSGYPDSWVLDYK